MDVAKSSAVEGGLNNFISKRHDERVEQEGERLAEEMWAESSGATRPASERRTAPRGVPPRPGRPPSRSPGGPRHLPRERGR